MPTGKWAKKGAKLADKANDARKAADKVGAAAKALDRAADARKAVDNAVPDKMLDDLVLANRKQQEEIFDAFRSKGKLDTGTEAVARSRGVTNLQRVSASEANAPFVKRGWNAPYAEGVEARTFTTGRDMQWARVHGAGNQQGRFLVRAKDIAGMTPQQIQHHLALPKVPTHISDVFVGSGVRMQMGRVAAQPSFGVTSTRGVQYQLIDNIPNSAFQNMRPLP